ncbi:MAG: HAMP domain-containing histidine kinase [Hyphomicrobiaceae bacterium]|nr:HAMP domain-containing histidine kinase [Hyphomicrobiaceae bacterium]
MPEPASIANDIADRAIANEPKRQLQRAVFDARQRLTSSTGTRASYDYELLAEYANARLSAALSVSVLVVILAAFASIFVPFAIAIGWAGVVVFTNLVVLLVARRFLKADKQKFNANRWTASFIFAETGFGVSWALLALFTIPAHNDQLAIVLFTMVLVGVATNALSTRTLMSATLMSTLPMTLTVAAVLVNMQSVLHYSLAAVLVGVEAFFVYLSNQLQRLSLRSYAMQSEKDALIADLEDARNASELARREAEHANIAKSRFLATMSHELRTPLNAIIGFSEVLKSELLGPHQVPQYKEYATDIHGSGQHLLTLINELLDLSRIEAGKYDLNEEVISLELIAEESLRMMQIRANAKNVDLITNIQPGLPKIWGDERAVRQVMLNLLSNAIKFTPQSGQIEVTVKRSADGGQIISIKDNGPGIPENEIPIVLASFGQGSLAAKTAEQGAGLGLPIVQKIMELHQGRFDLFSKVRFGTEAICTFPRARVMDAVAPIHERQDRLQIYSE